MKKPALSARPGFSNPGRFWLLVGILLLAAALRLAHAGAASLWFDEAFSVLVARLPLHDLLAATLADVHPPLYFVLLHGWQRVAGESEFAVRFFSGVCGLLAVAGTYRLSVRLFDRRTGLWAAGLMAVSPFQVYYAQEARFYTLCILLAVGLVWVFVAALARSRWSAWAEYVGLATLGLYTHYFFGLLLAALHLWAALYCRRWAVWRALLAGDAVIAALFLPIARLALSRVQTVSGGFWIERPSALAVLKTFDFLLFAGTTPRWLVPVALFGTIGLLVIVALDAVRFCRRQRAYTPAGMLGLLVVSVPLVVGFVVSQLGSSIYLDRSFALVTPAYLLLLAFGLAVRPRRSPALLLAALWGVVALASLGNFYFQPDPAKPAFREVGEFMTGRVEPGDVLLNLHDSTYFPLRYYAPQIAVYTLENDAPWLLPGAWAWFGTRVADDWTATQPTGTRLWAVVEPRMYGGRQQAVLTSLDVQWQRLAQFEAPGVQVFLFQKP